MKRLAEKEQGIRAYVNKDYHVGYLYDKQFKDQLDDWYTLTVALDTLGDSCSALIYFENEGIGTSTGEKYLRLYGVLQAIILQQDAINHLYRLFTENKLTIEDTSAWAKIREVRNMATGHPIGKKGKSEEGLLRIFLSQRSITSTGFTLMICEEKTGKTRHQKIDLKTLYEAYKLEALLYLSAIETALIDKWGPMDEDG